MFHSQFQGISIAVRQQNRILPLTTVNRPYGMYNIIRMADLICACYFGFACIASMQRSAFLQKPRPRCSVYGSVHTTAAQQRIVCSIHDCPHMHIHHTASYKGNMRLGLIASHSLYHIFCKYQFFIPWIQHKSQTIRPKTGMGKQRLQRLEDAGRCFALIELSLTGKNRNKILSPFISPKSLKPNCRFSVQSHCVSNFYKFPTAQVFCQSLRCFYGNQHLHIIFQPRAKRIENRLWRGIFSAIIPVI